MKFVSYRHQERTGYGVVQGERVTALMSPSCPSLRHALEREGVAGLTARAAAATGETHTLAALRLLPPIPNARKIICVGLNYGRHAEETGSAVPPHPTLFARFNNSFVGDGEPVRAPAQSEKFDYEAELGVVIGRHASQVAEADALAFVAGYCCLAENSVRDWQSHTPQVMPGKNFLRSGAMGPWLVTADEAPALERMQVIGRLNGEQMQSDGVASLIFPVARLISYISQFTELEPGDVIATGTPEGVGARRNPPRWLRPGDTFEVEIAGVGTLRNPVAAA